MDNEIRAEKTNLNEVFSRFWFLVPEYQRSYIWEKDNINDLLDVDILEKRQAEMLDNLICLYIFSYSWQFDVVFWH